MTHKYSWSKIGRYEKNDKSFLADKQESRSFMTALKI